MAILLNIVGLVLVALIGWWLTGYDSRLEGDGGRGDVWRRLFRIAVSLFLVEAMILVPFTMIFFAVFLGLVWAGCISELISYRFRKLIDPGFHDEGVFDPDKTKRYLDTIAHLIQNQRPDEAIRLCEELKKTGDVDRATLEMTLEFLGVKQDQAKISKPTAEARQLRLQGRFSEAETLLKSLLVKKPGDMEAGILLVRLYAEDLRQPNRAYEVLNELEKQPQVPTAPIEFARRSINEWCHPKPENAGTTEASKGESVDELLAEGFIGTAIERLEEKMKTQPQDYETRLKIVEVQTVYCKNFQRAEKIIRQMEADANFSPQQVAVVREKFSEWREAKPVTKA